MTARIIKEWHKKHCSEVEFVWPVQYPDLYIIEHLWSVLEIQAGHQFPLPSSQKELECILTENWLNVPLETIHKFYELIHLRIEYLIATNNGQTPH